MTMVENVKVWDNDHFNNNGSDYDVKQGRLLQNNEVV